MKKLVSVFALSLVSILPNAFAGTVYVDANDIASLPDCGGIVQTKISNGASQLNLVFNNVSQCSNFDIVSANGDKVNYPNQKLGGQNMARAGSFTIPSSYIDFGSNSIRVKVKSNSGKTSDTIVISVRKITFSTPSTMPTTYIHQNETTELSVCGGTVQTKVSNGQLNLIFRNVSQCSNFDIVKSNGDKVNYPNKKLGGTNGARSGSFTLPQSVVEFGLNTVRVKLQSNTGKTAEMLVINFLAF